MNVNERKIEINTQGGAVITGGVFIGTQFIANNPVKNERIETFSLNEKNSQEEELKNENEESHPDRDSSLLPDVFNTQKAQELFQKLVQSGYLNSEWHPIGLTQAQKGAIIDILSEELGYRTRQWKLFARFWGLNPDTLRATFHRAIETNSSLGDFQAHIKGVLNFHK